MEQFSSYQHPELTLDAVSQMIVPPNPKFDAQTRNYLINFRKGIFSQRIQSANKYMETFYKIWPQAQPIDFLIAIYLSNDLPRKALGKLKNPEFLQNVIWYAESLGIHTFSSPEERNAYIQTNPDYVLSSDFYDDPYGEDETSESTCDSAISQDYSQRSSSFGIQFSSQNAYTSHSSHSSYHQTKEPNVSPFEISSSQQYDSTFQFPPNFGHDDFSNPINSIDPFDDGNAPNPAFDFGYNGINQTGFYNKNWSPLQKENDFAPQINSLSLIRNGVSYSAGNDE